jgi:hypothetical protein
MKHLLKPLEIILTIAGLPIIAIGLLFAMITDAFKCGYNFYKDNL